MKCKICNYKLNEILSYKCDSCNINLCIKHRYKFAHNCIIDVKNNYKEILKNNNPVIVGEKVIKI